MGDSLNNSRASASPVVLDVSVIPPVTMAEVEPEEKSQRKASSRLISLGNCTYVYRIFLGFLIKLINNTNKRMIYPFAPALARFYGVPLSTLTWALAANEFSATLGIALGPIGDVIGYAPLYIGGGVLVCLALLVASSLPYFFAFVVYSILGGVGSKMVSVGIQSYVAFKTPEQSIGTVTGIVELAWGGAMLATVPVLGVLFHRLFWMSPFWLLLVVAVPVLVTIAFTMPHYRSGRPHGVNPLKYVLRETFKSIRSVVTNRKVLDGLAFSFSLQTIGAMLAWVMGVWLEDTWGLHVEQIGFIGIVIGAAEVLSSLTCSLISDRIGIWTSVTLGSALLCVACLLFAFLSNVSFWLGIVLVFCLFVPFEFTMIGSIALLSSTVPEARANTISMFFLAVGVGRATGAAVSPHLYAAGQTMAIGLASAAMALVCIGWMFSYKRTQDILLRKAGLCKSKNGKDMPKLDEDGIENSDEAVDVESSAATDKPSTE